MIDAFQQQLEEIEDELALLRVELEQLETAQQFEVPIPPSVNNLFLNVGKRRVRTRDYDAWIPLCEIAVKRVRPVVEYPVEIVLTVNGGKGFPTSRDIANCEKAVTDTLKKAGVLAEDAVPYIRRNVQEYNPWTGKPKDRPNAKCFVTIVEARKPRVAA